MDAGFGGNIELTAGAGGDSNPNGNSGTGGSILLQPGAPGTGGGNPGVYGDVIVAAAGGRVGDRSVSC